MKKDSHARFKLHLAQLFKQQRNEVKGYSQQKLAELANISVTTISRFELGEQLISLPTFIKLVDALEMDINEYIHIFRKVIDEDEANI